MTAKAPTPKSLTKGLKGAKKRGKKELDGAVDAEAAATVPSERRDSVAAQNWGLFEPLRGPLGPVVDLLGNMRVVVGILCLMVLWLWLRTPAAPNDVALFGSGRISPARMAAYEGMWRNEEDELWRWLESRVGGEERVWESLKDTKPKAGGDMNHREVEEAIKVTKERLQVLEDAVKRQKGKDR